MREKGFRKGGGAQSVTDVAGSRFSALEMRNRLPGHAVRTRPEWSESPVSSERMSASAGSGAVRLTRA